MKCLFSGKIKNTFNKIPLGIPVENSNSSPQGTRGCRENKVKYKKYVKICFLW